MDAFDVNLLSQVKALNQKMSVSHEQLHLKRKVFTGEKGKGKYPGKKLRKYPGSYEGELQGVSFPEEKENIIDITI
ncbi:MAG TPA: hypothetical protein PK528_01920 [Syntrophorhabdus sp.]|nr:hypothetical protein [Syntrophorhabdus sp.]